MKYCVRYNKNFRYKDIVDEVIYDYTSDIVDQIQKENWQSWQRIIIDLSVDEKGNEIPILKMVQKIHNNMTVMIDIKNKTLTRELEENELPFFFWNNATTLDTVYSMVQKKVTDIYITESLGFRIKDISEYLKPRGIYLRVFPNIAQYAVGIAKDIPDPCKFFIRPEDTDLYEPFVDVFDFWQISGRESIIFEIYKNKQWAGDLNHLINFNEVFHNASIPPQFGEARLNCGQKCMLERCRICIDAKELSNKFINDNIQIVKKKEGDWKYETRSYKEASKLVQETSAANDAEVF